jgi:type I restriction enzyme S subunit
VTVQRVAIHEVAEVNPKRLSKKPSAEQLVSFVPMSAVSEDTVRIEEPVDRPYSEVQKGYTPFLRGDVLVAKITPCFENGKMAHARDLPHPVGFGSTEFHVLRPTERVDGGYLFHLLREPYVRRAGKTKMKGAAGQRRVPAEFFASLEIPLPPLEEQKRIARILDEADALRAKRRESIEQLDALLQSIFLDMFGDPVKNPKGWEVSALGDLIVDGPQNGLYRPSSDYGEGTRILRIDGFYDGKMKVETSLKRVRIPDAEIDKYALQPGDVVVNRVNSREYLGKSALVPPLSEPVVYESNMMRFRIDQDEVHPRFVVQCLQTDHVKRQVLNACKDAVNQSSINQTDVRALRLYVPPIDEQLRFVRAVTGIESLSEPLARHLTELDRLFASLQQRAFAGELW